MEYEIENKNAIHQVMYEPERIFISNLLEQCRVELSAKGMKRTPSTERLMRTIMQFLYIKGKDWEHEKEYRIVAHIDDDKGKRYNITDLGIKAKRIIAGINCTAIDRLNDISNRIGCGNVYVSSLSNTRYGLEITKK